MELHLFPLSLQIEIQLFCHGITFSGSWMNPDKQLISILHSDEGPKPIQILPKFIKDDKLKPHSANEFALLGRSITLPS
jgi:hypothetical protein